MSLRSLLGSSESCVWRRPATVAPWIPRFLLTIFLILWIINVSLFLIGHRMPYCLCRASYPSCQVAAKCRQRVRLCHPSTRCHRAIWFRTCHGEAHRSPLPGSSLHLIILAKSDLLEPVEIRFWFSLLISLFTISVPHLSRPSSASSVSAPSTKASWWSLILRDTWVFFGWAAKLVRRWVLSHSD